MLSWSSRAGIRRVNRHAQPGPECQRLAAVTVRLRRETRLAAELVRPLVQTHAAPTAPCRTHEAFLLCPDSDPAARGALPAGIGRGHRGAAAAARRGYAPRRAVR